MPAIILLMLAGLTAAPQTAPADTGPRDFTVKAGDKEFKLSDARGKYVALHFLLKTECPLCLRHTRTYTSEADKVAGVIHVFLKPDPDEDIRRWAAKLPTDPKPPLIYRDPDATLAKAYDIPDGYAFHGQTVHYPALVLLGPDGREVFRYIGKSNSDRLSFEKFAARVAQLSADPAGREWDLDRKKIALKGYDPVAYIAAGKAEAGKEDITSVYRGITCRFANADNRHRFAADPEKYLPAYGGWCATAMAEGNKVEIDPASFKVTEGRLFLFYKGGRGDALQAWNRDEPNLTRRADQQWKQLTDRAMPKEKSGE